MMSFLGDDCHVPWLFLKMKFLRTNFHLRLTGYTHTANATTVLPTLHVGPDNPAQTLDSREERHCKMAQELMRVERGKHNSSDMTAIISVFLWKLVHNFMDRKEAGDLLSRSLKNPKRFAVNPGRVTRSKQDCRNISPNAL